VVWPKTCNVRRRILVPGAVLLSTLGMALPSMAQVVPTPPPKTVQSGPTEPAPTKATDVVRVDTWSETESQRLFQACDGDADDLLDVFEASQALETVGSPRELDRFRHLDSDHDGFLSWPEFDAHFRDVVEHGGTFVVRPVRALPPARKDAPAPATPAEILLQLFDADHSGDLSADETNHMLAAAKLPTGLQSQLSAFDRDLSNTLSVDELQPLLAVSPQLQALVRAEPAPNQLLPPPFDAMDRNADGQIDVEELAAGLRQIDPLLARWSAAILKSADHDGDQRLGGSELRDATTAAATERPLGSR
jgi:Ca2+-binding EF-hand superfamily protein